MTLITGHTHHFFLLTPSFRTFVCENLKQRHTSSVLVYCQSDGTVKHFSLILTFLFRCAGSDLQSLSICSPTLMSGISPLLMGIGMLHRGHTGTWTSFRKNKMKHIHSTQKYTKVQLQGLYLCQSSIISMMHFTAVKVVFFITLYLR